MAPSRRKGANKASAAVALRKWKIGDLVLAKVKGFPPWPATVSKPQKYGYTVDLRKIFVYFFGTQQIAFCNPVDVEEFTEEKKVSLLGKRHGKDSDFVRALNEIIDCFEKLKEQQVVSDNVTEETIITKENNSDEPLTRSLNNDADVTAHRICSGATGDLQSLTEVAVAAAAEDALHDEMLREERHSNSGSGELRVYSTRSKTDAVQSQNIGPQRRISARRLRSSSRADTSMTVDSDSDRLNISQFVNSSCKRVTGDPIAENNKGEAKLSDRLDFRGIVTIIKKKRKRSRKRHCSNMVAKLDEVSSETEMPKIECVSPSNDVKQTEICCKKDGDEHLPLLKRARVRMGRSSPAGDNEGKLAPEEENILDFPESLSDRGSDHAVGNPDAPSNLHASPARKPQYWKTRNNFVDGEAALPPSKRLHRALEAMSANAAEHGKKCSSSPILDTHTEAHSSSKWSEPCVENLPWVELRSGHMENHSCCASEICVLNMEVLENDGKITEAVLDCGKTSSGTNSSCPELCEKLSEHFEDVESKRLKLSPLNECADAEYQNATPDLLNNVDDFSHLVKPIDLKKDAKNSDADISPINPESNFMEENVCPSVNIEKCIHRGSADGGHQPQKMEHLSLSEKNQNSQRPESRTEAGPGCAGSDVTPSARPVKVLNTGPFELRVCSSTVSNGHLEGNIASVTRSSLCVTDGPELATKASPPSSSVCNNTPSDGSVEKNSFCSNAQLLLEKGKPAAKSSSKIELFQSFEAITRSLTRTKESIGRATRVAIDCAKSGQANKVVELLARHLESESSPHKKVDLFFLVDSIAQCSGGMKGKAGIYPSVIQVLLPRLLLAAASPGTTFYENHKLCLKVLKVWLERKILPEAVVRRHIRELDTLSGLHATGGSRRACRFERPFDDPIREMEGLLVDEYGSNSSIQLPGFCMPPMRRDEDTGSDSDGENFEAVTPEHNVENLNGETTVIAKTEKRSHILEDVDGELEMEDVAPTCDIEMIPTSNTTGTDCNRMLHTLSDNHHGAPFDPQQPMDTHLICTRFPRSPLRQPPSAPPSQPPPPPPSMFPGAVLISVSKVPEHHPSSQEPFEKRSLSPRVRPRTMDAVHRRCYEDRDSEAQFPQMPYYNNTNPYGEQPTSHLSGRASSDFYPVDGALSKDFHLHPPHPASSNQFSFVSEQRTQSRRYLPHHPPPNRFHTRSTENPNYYRDRDRSRFGQRDNIGEHWRPPLPSISGPYHQNSSRMVHAPMSYNGSAREPAFSNYRWNFPPRSMKHRGLSSISIS